MPEQSVGHAGATRTSGIATDWRDRYSGRLAITDSLVLVWAVFGAQFAWLGADSEAMGFSGSRDDIGVSYTVVSLIIVVIWMGALAAYGTRGYRVVGSGTQEYKLIADATIRVFGLVAIVAFLIKLDLARGYVLISLPLGLVVLLFSRWLWRQWLNVKRSQNEFVSKVVLVGTPSSSALIARELARVPTAGYVVVGACVPDDDPSETLPGIDIPVIGTFDSALSALRVTGADTLVITSADELSPDRVRQLSWGLEPGRQHLVVVPSLVDIGGPRLHTRPVAGLPLIHVETPRYEGRKQFAKRALDLLGAAGIIVVLSPLLLMVTLLVKLGSRGPILFRQERVGINGSTFEMLKFRSMVVDAEDRLKALEAEMDRDAGNSVMFKMKDDPRITPVGKFLRRFSIDELPQLFNVLGGSMSLVGPRPPLVREMNQYARHVHRRFLVKPGLTGLWQVSGRSNLSWEETVRLDLYYVENWSLTGDIIILWRTVKAVFARDGAY
ncbi:sugar transferase [Agromyces atrinae]|uniref:sugar transferase n=1 Tax=Agromyces atrinae TaxID=592376 RepID=UPI001F5ACA83|nr:sugar transferase [Agromyces atrinae]MCI2956083.1 sugar transferase [Agromyces atrinae]